MKIVKKSKNPKLIPCPDMTLLKYMFSEVQLCIKYQFLVNFANFRIFCQIAIRRPGLNQSQIPAMEFDNWLAYVETEAMPCHSMA